MFSYNFYNYNIFNEVIFITDVKKYVLKDNKAFMVSNILITISTNGTDSI